MCSRTKLTLSTSPFFKPKKKLNPKPGQLLPKFAQKKQTPKRSTHHTTKTHDLSINKEGVKGVGFGTDEDNVADRDGEDGDCGWEGGARDAERGGG